MVISTKGLELGTWRCGIGEEPLPPAPDRAAAKTTACCTHQLAHGLWPLDRGCLNAAETRCLRDCGAGVGPVVEQGARGPAVRRRRWERGSVPTRAGSDDA